MQLFEWLISKIVSNFNTPFLPCPCQRLYRHFNSIILVISLSVNNMMSLRIASVYSVYVFYCREDGHGPFRGSPSTMKSPTVPEQRQRRRRRPLHRQRRDQQQRGPLQQIQLVSVNKNCVICKYLYTFSDRHYTCPCGINK